MAMGRRSVVTASGSTSTSSWSCATGLAPACSWKSAGRTGVAMARQGMIAASAFVTATSAPFSSGFWICLRKTCGKTSGRPSPTVLLPLAASSRPKCACAKLALCAVSCVVCRRSRTGWSMFWSSVCDPPAISNEGGS